MRWKGKALKRKEVFNATATEFHLFFLAFSVEFIND
jgi:hypothetical protein